MLAILTTLAGFAGKLLSSPATWIIGVIVGAALTINVLRLDLNTANANAAAWRKASDAWSANAGAWKASFTASERIRAREQSTANTAASTLSTQCDARVAEARRSAAAINTLVTKAPTYDASHCPVRSLFDHGSLRDALGAAAGG